MRFALNHPQIRLQWKIMWEIFKNSNHRFENNKDKGNHLYLYSIVVQRECYSLSISAFLFESVVVASTLQRKDWNPEVEVTHAPWWLAAVQRLIPTPSCKSMGHLFVRRKSFIFRFFLILWIIKMFCDFFLESLGIINILPFISSSLNNFNFEEKNKVLFKPN